MKHMGICERTFYTEEPVSTKFFKWSLLDMFEVCKEDEFGLEHHEKGQSWKDTRSEKQQMCQILSGLVSNGKNTSFHSEWDRKSLDNFKERSDIIWFMWRFDDWEKQGYQLQGYYYNPDENNLDQGRSGTGTKWSDSPYILKIEPKGFAGVQGMW